MFQRPNYTQIPNSFFDEKIRILEPSEVVVFAIIARKTFGWHKKRDAISLSQLTEATGLSRPTIIKAVDGLIAKDMIRKIPTNGKITEYEVLVEGETEEQSEEKPKPASKNSLQAELITSKESLPDQLNIFTGTSKESLPTKEKEKNTTKEKEDAPDGAYAKVMDIFYRLHIDSTGAKPLINGVIGKQIKNLLKSEAVEVIEKKLRKYYQGDLWFTKDQCFSFKDFVAHYNAIPLKEKQEKQGQYTRDKEEILQGWGLQA